MPPVMCPGLGLAATAGRCLSCPCAVRSSLSTPRVPKVPPGGRWVRFVRCAEGRKGKLFSPGSFAGESGTEAAQERPLELGVGRRS